MAELPLPEGYCTIRDVVIASPVRTHCANYHTRRPVPDGPVFSHFNYHQLPERFVDAQGYPRIPWNGRHPPQWESKYGGGGTCSFCGRQFENGGISVATDEEEMKRFCGESHYVRWWKNHYPGQVLKWDYPWAEIDARKEKEHLEEDREHGSGGETGSPNLDNLWTMLRDEADEEEKDK
jgi:hypothetical protein